ncbi:hypothetical protein [Acidianus two-tailed virus 2]|nr:hypothetical protein [Acidianus two-tailed virus 2]
MMRHVKTVRVFLKPKSKIVFDNTKTKEIREKHPCWFVQGDLRVNKTAVIFFTNTPGKKGIPYVPVPPGKYQIKYYDDKIVITKLETLQKIYMCLVFPISRKAYLLNEFTIADSTAEKNAINIYFDRPMKYKKEKLSGTWYKYVFEEDISAYFMQAKARIKS